VKLVYRLLPDLPPDRSYRALFMRRRLDEVFASQEAMLGRKPGNGEKSPGRLEVAAFEKLFTQELQRITQWLARQSHFRVLSVDYNQMMQDPGPQLEAISRFLGGGLRIEAMREVVEPSLYRRRA
jgi:hypothetical protein